MLTDDDALVEQVAFQLAGFHKPGKDAGPATMSVWQGAVNKARAIIPIIRKTDAARIKALEERLIDVTAHLVAAVSVLERAHAEKKQPKLVVASNAIFEQSLKDYAASYERARATLTKDQTHDR